MTWAEVVIAPPQSWEESAPPARVIGVSEFHQLPQGLFGVGRASALAEVDQQHFRASIMIADLTYDPSYAEILSNYFARRVIGVQIGRYGDGSEAETRILGNGRSIPVYNVGRNYLIENLHNAFVSRNLRLVDSPEAKLAFAQLANLETECRDTGTVYKCAPGQHDDLAMSIAMLVFAAQHRHLEFWHRTLENDMRPRPRSRAPFTAAGWT